MLVTCQQMAAAEERLFSAGASPEPYMDLAGARCAGAIRRFHPAPGRAAVFCGRGNNGGDALVVARWLKRWGWEVELHFSDGKEGLSGLAGKKLAELEAEPAGGVAPPGGDEILVDGLLGIGARGDLRGGILEQARLIARLREERFATCYAIDIPTGLDADSGVPGKGAVQADATLTITAAKAGFACDSSADHVGRLVEIPLDIPVPEADRDIAFLFPSNLRPRLQRRPFSTHKGAAGRVGIIAGAPGTAGAAVLAATGASRIGAGLVTVFATEKVYPLLAARCPVETMVRPVSRYGEAAGAPCDAWAVGPGLGLPLEEEVLDLICTHESPAVVDADALNALAKQPRRLEGLPSNRVLTPHPGELARLLPEGFEPGERVATTRSLADRWGVTLLHKGARTAVASPGRPVELNSTGHPGMASGGMGDVLTGVCAGLVAQGLDPHDAACAGSWLLGRAAELAALRGDAALESVTAVETAECLGAALRDLQRPWFR